MTDIQRINAEVCEPIIAAGAQLVHRNGKRFYETNGEYTAFPPGYISGPWKTPVEDLHCSRPWYVSVQTADGWWQRGFNYEHDAIVWAVQASNETRGI